MGDDYQSGNGFFCGRDAGIAYRAFTRIGNVGWLREITFGWLSNDNRCSKVGRSGCTAFEMRGHSFLKQGVQFFLADLWRRWVFDEAVKLSIAERS
ncbi:hypothetical protein ACU8OR_32980 (plasmid) [Rhizobium leguminosarum]